MHLLLGSTQLDLTRRAAVVGLVAPTDDLDDLDDVVGRAVGLRDAGADVVWIRRAAGAPVGELVARVAAALHHPVGVDVVDHVDVEAVALAGAVLVGLDGHRPDDLAAAAEHGLSVYLDAAPGTGLGLDRSRLVVEGHLDDPTALHGCTVSGTGPAAWARVVLGLQAGVQVVRTVDVHAVRRVATVAAELLAARDAAAEAVS